MSQDSFSNGEVEAVDADGRRVTMKWNEPRQDVPHRASVRVDADDLGLAGLRLRAESILARSCGPAEMEALEGLGPEIGQVLVKMARKQDDCVPYCHLRAGAIAALGHLRLARAVDTLGGLVSDRGEDVAIRAQATLALGRIGSDGAVDILGQVLVNDRDAAVRRAAAKGLGESGSLHGAGVLERAIADDDDEGVRRQAGSSMSVLEKLHDVKLTDVKRPAPPRRRRPERHREAEERYAARLQKRKR